MRNAVEVIKQLSQDREAVRIALEREDELALQRIERAEEMRDGASPEEIFTV